MVQDALRAARAVRLKGELHALQNIWAKKAKAKGVLTEADLERLLRT